MELEAQVLDLVQQQIDVGQLMARDAFAEAARSRWRLQRECVLRQGQRKLANH